MPKIVKNCLTPEIAPLNQKHTSVEKCFFFSFRFLILQMSHTNQTFLAVDSLFSDCLPSYESRDVSKEKLKSPAKTACLWYKFLIASNILPRSGRVALFRYEDFKGWLGQSLSHRPQHLISKYVYFYHFLCLRRRL